MAKCQGFKNWSIVFLSLEVFYYPETIYHAFMEEKGRLDLENDDDALSRKTKSFCTQLWIGPQIGKWGYLMNIQWYSIMHCIQIGQFVIFGSVR